MMTIEQIKKAMKYAEGFEYEKHDYGGFIISTGQRINKKQFGCSERWIDIYYPLFLQRTIEGINRANIEYRIEQCYNMVEVLDSEEYDVIINYLIRDNPDQAKEQGIIWVLEHEDD